MVGMKSMAHPASEVHNLVENKECGVSGDRTWQKRGHSSLNGCVSLISVDTGKVIDVEGLSRKCRACESRCKLGASSQEHLEWKADHTNCHANPAGTAGAMEAVGLYRMCERWETRQLKYIEFYGDGNSKSHVAVKDIYGNDSIQKLECIGHVQKHAGCRLSNVRAQTWKQRKTDRCPD